MDRGYRRHNAGRSAQTRRLVGRALAAGLLSATSLLFATSAGAQPLVPASLQAAAALHSAGQISSYYAHEGGPLWVKPDGSLDPAAAVLVQLIATAGLDGLDPQALGLDALNAAVARASQDRSEESLARAEAALSTALANYAVAMRQPTPGSQMIYEHDVLRPIAPDAVTIMRSAAQAPSLLEYVTAMGWMHPLYGELRQKLMNGEPTPEVRSAAVGTLDRLRALPVPFSRHVLLDIVGARLWMYENGQPVDSMKVIVGKVETQTPIMAGYIRYATLNPYWNVPAELLRTTIANGVLNQGVGYLKARGYEVFENWEEGAAKLDPASVDWKAVKRGELNLRVRQKPGGANSMGNVKYEFPNPQGIYLHDTPSKELMSKAVRQLSNGCVRLEDAERLGRWLLGGNLPRAGAGPEHRVDLAEPVPIYITYLTARPEGTTIALGTDPYGLDMRSGPALAQAGVR
jgi:murein L,D-transpeptidase YcbB/YkuD